MDFKLILMLSALGMTCAASIQDPYIHDSLEDQIAMESGPTQTVVAAPPHLQAAAAAAAAFAPEPTEVEADGETAAEIEAVEIEAAQVEAAIAKAAEAEAAEDEAAAQADELNTDTKESTMPFTVLFNDEPIEPPMTLAVAPHRRPTGAHRPFAGFPVRRPAVSPLMQMPLLSRLQSQLQYGSSLAGYGASPVILLQPIIVPVPMSARDAEQHPNALAERVMSSLMYRQPVKQPSLMDVLQRAYYGF